MEKKWIKYPLTMYFSFSPSIDNKDKKNIFDINNFVGKNIVFTVKMDGSNLTMTKDHVGARNGWDAQHESFDMAKAEHAKIKHMIPENIQLFGEWLYAKHSIKYNNLANYFQIFSAFDMEGRKFLSWMETEAIARNVGFPTVPWIVTYLYLENECDLAETIEQQGNSAIGSGEEGLVVRLMDSFSVDDFSNSVAKYVRKGHVQTDEHWSHKAVERNQLK